MARQNVGKPKFYVDLLSYWWARGNIAGVGFKNNPEGIYNWHMANQGGYRPSILGLNPTEYLNEDFYYENDIILRVELKDIFNLPENASDQFFFGFLGHSFKSSGYTNPRVKFYTDTGWVRLIVDDFDEICNMSTYGFQYDGWSMGKWTNVGHMPNSKAIEFTIDKPQQGNIQSLLGSLCFGNLFEMPHSPDLELTINRDFEGYSTQNTIGGSTLTQVNYFRPPDWAGFPAWELFDEDAREYTQETHQSRQSSARGRRSWSLSFSYLDSEDLFAVNENWSKLNPTDSDTFSSSGYNSGDFDNMGNFNTNISQSSSFLSVLMNNTLGGALPFIFQPDGNNNSPDQFAICRIDRDSFSFNQVAHNTYNVSMNITESW